MMSSRGDFSSFSLGGSLHGFVYRSGKAMYGRCGALHHTREMFDVWCHRGDPLDTTGIIKLGGASTHFPFLCSSAFGYNRPYSATMHKLFRSTLRTKTASSLVYATVSRRFQEKLFQVLLWSRSNSTGSSLAKDNSITGVKVGGGYKGHDMLAPFVAGWQTTDLHPLVIDKSEGSYVYDINGKKYLDTLAGLWSITLGGNEPRLVNVAIAQLKSRMSFVAYLASYLSCAKFLSAALVSSIIQRLVYWCFDYCKSHDLDMNPRAHQVFYSRCQAIMYVLCFRMRSLMDVPRLKLQLLNLLMEPIWKHKIESLESVFAYFSRGIS